MKTYGQNIPSDLFDEYIASLQPETYIKNSYTGDGTEYTEMPTDFTFFQYVRMRFPFRIPHMQDSIDYKYL